MFEELKKGISTQVRLEKKDQMVYIDEEISRIMSSAAERGMVGSSNTVVQISETGLQALRVRGQFIWKIIWRFVTTAGISYSENLEKELLTLFTEYFEDTDDIKVQMQSRNLFGAAFNHVIEMMLKEYDKEYSDTLDRISSEIGLFVISLKGKEKKEENLSTVLFNIYSPVGAIQTGNGAISNITQNINVEAKNSIISAFDMLLDKLPEIRELSQKDEIVDLVDDGKNELLKEKPNSLKIQNCILTIGSMIQTSAALKPAYDLLKNGAAYLGINLP